MMVAVLLLGTSVVLGQTGGSIFDMRLSAPFAETGDVVDTSLRSSIAAADKKSVSH